MLLISNHGFQIPSTRNCIVCQTHDALVPSTVQFLLKSTACPAWLGDTWRIPLDLYHTMAIPSPDVLGWFPSALPVAGSSGLLVLVAALAALCMLQSAFVPSSKPQATKTRGLIWINWGTNRTSRTLLVAIVVGLRSPLAELCEGPIFLSNQLGGCGEGVSDPHVSGLNHMKSPFFVGRSQIGDGGRCPTKPRHWQRQVRCWRPQKRRTRDCPRTLAEVDGEMVDVRTWTCIEKYMSNQKSISNININNMNTSTAQGGGGSFKNRTPIGEVGCCESRMAERIHWWTERWLKLWFLEWLQWLQWSPHPQLLDEVWCSAVVVVVVVWCSGVVVVMCNKCGVLAVAVAVVVVVWCN